MLLLKALKKMKNKQVIDLLMAMHMQAEIPWQPGKFVVYDEIHEDWTPMDLVSARQAQLVADYFLIQMITGW